MGAPGSHNLGISGALVRQGASSSLRSCLASWGTCLAHHRHQRGLAASGCLDQHQLMPCVSGEPGQHSIGTTGALDRQGASNSLRSSLCCFGHLSGTPAGPCCERMPRPASAHALCVWGTSLAQHRHQCCLGSPRCLEHSRHILLLLGAPVLHTISTSEALVRADAWTSTGSSLVLLGHLSRMTSALAGPWCAKVP